MSITPVPERLNRMVFSSLGSFMASIIAPRMAWLLSGAGMMPSVRAKRMPASKHSIWCTALGWTMPSRTRAETMGAMPW